MGVHELARRVTIPNTPSVATELYKNMWKQHQFQEVDLAVCRMFQNMVESHCNLAEAKPTCLGMCGKKARPALFPMEVEI